MSRFEEEGIQSDIRPPQGMPESLADLQNYELVILSNVPATKLTQQQMEITRTYLQELGGGFIMLGGEQSFGLGGYYKSSLEEVLPVRSDFEKEKENPSLGMMLVIDKSGSMDGDKIEMAKSAARSAVELIAQPASVRHTERKAAGFEEWMRRPIRDDLIWARSLGLPPIGTQFKNIKSEPVLGRCSSG